MITTHERIAFKLRDGVVTGTFYNPHTRNVFDLSTLAERHASASW